MPDDPNGTLSHSRCRWVVFKIVFAIASAGIDEWSATLLDAKGTEGFAANRRRQAETAAAAVAVRRTVFIWFLESSARINELRKFSGHRSTTLTLNGSPSAQTSSEPSVLSIAKPYGKS